MLTLRFFVEIDNVIRLVISPAKINKNGQYMDYRYIYTEEGDFERRKIKGVVEEIFED